MLVDLSPITKMFIKTKKKVKYKLKKIQLNEFKLDKKKIYIIPLGSSICLGDLNNRKVKNFLKKKLHIYLTFKKRVLSLFLTFNIFPKKEMLLPREADLMMLGNRIKLFDFKNNKIKTLGKNSQEIKERRKYGKILNSPKIIFAGNHFFTEELIFPHNNLNEKDVLNAFEKLIEIYKKNKKFISIKNLFLLKRKRKSNYMTLDKELKKIKDKKVYCSWVHGDFWKGNLLKRNGKIFFLDLDCAGKGLIVEDLFKYFLSSQIYSGKINKNLMKKMCCKLMSSLNLSKDELLFQINLESYILMMNKNKKIKKNVLKTKENLFRIIKSISK